MAQRKPILIGCPQYHCLVRGSYACDGDGRLALGRGGQFLLDSVRCGHRGGRCMQTLCALHRYNRRAPGTWLPEAIWTTPLPGGQKPAAAAAPPAAGGWYA